MTITQPLFNINWLDFSLLTSTEEVEAIANLNLFPNPGKGLFHLEGQLKEKQNVEVQVFDLLGQVVWQKSLRDVAQLSEPIDLMRLPAGNYLIRLQLEDGRIVQKKAIKMEP